jgi:Ca-activated chloride channel family protein
MTFNAPALLLAGLVVVAGLVTGAVLVSRRRAAVFAEAGLALPRSRARAGIWLTIAGVAVLVLAVAGPAASLPVTRAAGTVIIAMDVSNSMAATDVDPSRLEAAKQAALGFIDAQPDSVDIGVVAFQSDALATSLVSADHSVAAGAVQRLNGSGGTSLSNAILASLSAITGKPVTLPDSGSSPGTTKVALRADDTPGYWPSATIVLFSDGENFNGSVDRLQAAAELAQTMGVHIETVGVGTAAGTTVIVDGFAMHTALDEDLLTAIATATGGSYHPATDATELAGIAKGINLRLTTKNQDVPLAGALSGVGALLLLAGSVLTVLRTGRLI